MENREIRYRNPVFSITVGPATSRTFYLRCQDSGSVPLPVTLWEPGAFFSSVKNRQIVLGGYYGSLLVIILYNSLIFLTVRIRSYFFYVIFVVSYLFWQLIYNGLANEYLWPNSPWITHWLMPFFICTTAISALLFVRDFLRTRENAPGLHKWFSLLLGGFILVALLSFFPGFTLAIPFAALACVLFALTALLTGFLCWKRGYRPARYFSVAWFVLLGGTALLGLKSFGLLPSNFITEYGQQIGSVLEIALLSLALADQLGVMRQEKEMAQKEAMRIQEEVNWLLEEKVRQRTKELVTRNQQLQLLSNKLSKYLSPQVYSAIFSGQTEVRLHSYRKKLTVFFSDIKGFTELTDSMESEPLTSLLNEYLDNMAEIALKHGGTIDKYIGDAIMIFFGDPETRGEKEDALACVRMAIEMRNQMKKLQRKWQDQMLPKPLRIRMGVNTGYCTVGNFGSEDRFDYTIIGGQVNLASRLESNANPDEILISYQTYVLIKDAIACEAKGAIQVKGLAYPVLTYQVIDSYEILARENDEIRTEGEGYAIALDFNRISDKALKKIISSLEKALARLEPRSPVSS